jgi:L-fuculose-phosphate aldolase
MGTVPLAPYGTPSTSEIPEGLEPLLKSHDAFLLQNHGALTLGRDVFQAYYRMESIEHFAHILYLARGLGDVNLLDRSQVEKLKEIRSRYGLQGEVPVCRFREASGDPDPFRLANLMEAMPAPAPALNVPAPETPAAATPATPGTDPELVDAVVRQVLARLRSRQE